MNDFLLTLITGQEAAAKTSIFKEITDLVQVLIWPITVIVALAMFRKIIAQKIEDLDEIKASPTAGLSASFKSALENVQANPLLLPAEGQSKSGAKILVDGESIGTPFEQLQELRAVLNGKIISKAKDLNLPVENQSAQSLAQKLKEVGGLTIQQQKAYNELINVINLAPRDIPQGQVNQVESLVSNLSI